MKRKEKLYGLIEKENKPLEADKIKRQGTRERDTQDEDIRNIREPDMMKRQETRNK
jgi:hypothetical protein